MLIQIEWEQDNGRGNIKMNSAVEANAMIELLTRDDHLEQIKINYYVGGCCYTLYTLFFNQ